MLMTILIGTLVNLFTKLVLWIIEKNMSGTPLTAEQKALVDQVTFLSHKLTPEANKAGCSALGTPPPNWDQLLAHGNHE